MKIPIKELALKYKHALWLLIYPLTGVWYFLIEHIGAAPHPIHCALDDLIPFSEWAVLPYLFWFVYIVGSLLWLLFFRPKQDFLRALFAMYTGMAVCLLIITIYPTEILFRPDTVYPGQAVIPFADKNFLTWLTQNLVYTADRPMNCFPSIHCCNALMIFSGVLNAGPYKYKKAIVPVMLALALLICWSTVGLKQHSILDVLGAFVVAAIVYLIWFVPDWKKFKSTPSL